MRYLLSLLMLLSVIGIFGCAAVRDQIPFGYGPRANEEPDLDPRKQTLEGIIAERNEDTIVVKWSYPMTNTWRMPAEATVKASIHCAYGAEGKQNQFEGTAKMSVLPGSTRLLSGEVAIPVSCIEVKNLGQTDPTTWFDRVTWSAQWSHVLSDKGPLTFEWTGVENDQAMVIWVLRAVSVAHRVEASAKNADGKTIDTGTYDLEAICTLVDRDGRAYASDVSTGKGRPGEVEFRGGFRKPISELLNVDWGESAVVVRRLIP